jgi:hypothetical protein
MMKKSRTEEAVIAEFEVKALTWRQSYQLYHDRITVDARYTFSGHSSSVHLLRDLSRYPTRGSSRGEHLYMGVLLMVVGFGFMGWLYFIDGFYENRVPPVLLLMATSGLVWFLLSLRMLHYTIFISPSGQQALTLWSTAKQKDAFDDFVQKCQKAIEASTDEA